MAEPEPMAISSHATPPDVITVFTRPGVRTADRLVAKLNRAGYPLEVVDIVEDTAGAAYVARLSTGDVSLPVVALGGLTLFAPSLRDVRDAVASKAPHLTPDRTPSRWTLLRA